MSDARPPWPSWPPMASSPGAGVRSPGQLPGWELPPPPPRRGRAWTIAGGILLALGIVVVIAGIVIQLPYVIVSPGEARAVDDVVRISDAKTYHHKGEVLFLTVRISSRRPNVWGYLEASLDPDRNVISEDEILGNLSRRQDAQLNQELMTQSQQIAKKVALERLGYTVPVEGKGAVVVQLVKKGPAAGALDVGDVITAVGGAPVHLADDLGPLIRAHKPGDAVTLTVDHDGATNDVMLTTADQEGQAFVGVAVQTKDLRFRFPISVTIDPGPVSGPSAGLAFALTILDELSPKNLTGGTDVAVTGEIAFDGSVREVGGVAQKAVTARDAGATLMIVPRAEAKEAKEHAGDMAVVGVGTLADALEALHRNGGAKLASRSALQPAA